MYRNSFRSLIVRAQAAAMRKGGEERRDRSSRVLDQRAWAATCLALATDAAFPPLEIEGPCAVSLLHLSHYHHFVYLDPKSFMDISIVVDQGQGSLPLGVQGSRSPDSKGGFRLRYELPRDCTRSPLSASLKQVLIPRSILHCTVYTGSEHRIRETSAPLYADIRSIQQLILVIAL
jgi:hypothetical protein